MCMCSEMELHTGAECDASGQFVQLWPLRTRALFEDQDRREHIHGLGELVFLLLVAKSFFVLSVSLLVDRILLLFQSLLGS